jgi:hypothetical protein
MLGGIGDTAVASRMASRDDGRLRPPLDSLDY